MTALQMARWGQMAQQVQRDKLGQQGRENKPKQTQ